MDADRYGDCVEEKEEECSVVCRGGKRRGV